MTTEDWITHLYAVLPNPGQAAILVIDTPAGPTLPQASLVEEIDPARVVRVQPALNAACKLPSNLLRCLASEFNQEQHLSDALYLFEARPEGLQEGGLPEGARWMDVAGLSPDELVPTSLRKGLAGALAEIQMQASQGKTWQAPPLRVGWALPGWYAMVETWIAGQAARLGISVRDINPIKSWSISVVLRVRTDSRTVFFKASRDLPLFVNEGVVMEALADLFPGRVPAPLAVDSARGWMLLEDFGEPLGRNASIDLQARLFQEMAQIQVESTGQVERLLRAGCIDRRLPWLQDRLEALLEDDVSFSLVAPADREKLHRSLPRLQSFLDELESLPIPPALVHGDLHTGNVSIREGNLLFFDWTDAAITHPFFDLFDIFVVKDPIQRETLEAAYRGPWEAAYPAGQVRRAMELARVVFGLYHAISYQYLLNNIEEADRPDLNSVNFFLQQVLAGLAGMESAAPAGLG